MVPSVQSLRRTALLWLEHAGANRVIADTAWRRRRLLILAYHGISQDDEHEWNGALYMSADMLRERLKILRAARCTVLPFGEALDRLSAGTLPPRSVAVTFDDGYVDFATRAHPLLTEYGIPPTVYLPTLRLGWSMPVFPLAYWYLLWKSRLARVIVPELRSEPFELGSTLACRTAAASILAIARRDRMSRDDKDRLGRILAQRVGGDYDALFEKRLFQVMSPADVSRLAAEGVDFQLHTHTHNTPGEREAFATEIETNRARIRELTGTTPVHFCYPSGVHDPRFLPWLTELGVRSATTCDPGLATPATPPLMLPRFVDTSSTSAVEFHGWLTGTSALISRRKSYARKAG